jgi:hypothetical protein
VTLIFSRRVQLRNHICAASASPRRISCRFISSPRRPSVPRTLRRTHSSAPSWQMFELVHVEEHSQMRRRCLEVFDRRGIGVGQVARQLFDNLLHLRRIAWRGAFAIRSFEYRLQFVNQTPEALLKRRAPDFDLSRRSRARDGFLQIGSPILNSGSAKISRLESFCRTDAIASASPLRPRRCRTTC